MTYLIADVAPKNNNTDNVRMIEPAEDLHLAPDAALVPLDLLLRDDLERDLDGERVGVRAGRGTVAAAATVTALQARGLGERGEAEVRARARARRRGGLAARGRGRVGGRGRAAEGDVDLARGDVPCCPLGSVARRLDEVQV